MKSVPVPVGLLSFCKVSSLLGIVLVIGTITLKIVLDRLDRLERIGQVLVTIALFLVRIGGNVVNKFLELFSVLVTAGEALYRAFRNLKKFFKGE
ncbi:hypothetical protein [Chicken microvirus mg7_14]|nr:hypothetical protein [Chicken microvirus mg7_14]